MRRVRVRSPGSPSARSTLEQPPRKLDLLTR